MTVGGGGLFVSLFEEFWHNLFQAAAERQISRWNVGEAGPQHDSSLECYNLLKGLFTYFFTAKKKKKSNFSHFFVVSDIEGPHISWVQHQYCPYFMS